MKRLLKVLLLAFSISGKCFSQTTITFPSLDGLTVTADLYKANDTAAYIVLCHLAQHSRGEYKEIARRLNKAGYNCLAIDTRTGNEVSGIFNQTALEAKKQHKPTSFLDSEQDMVAAVNYADSVSNDKGVILFGSSFSASLALKIAATNEKVDAVVAFSPGEHFGTALNLAHIIKPLDKPAFVTSSQAEAKSVTDLLKEVNQDKVTQYIPQSKGAHGSIALWDYNPDSQAYWDALFGFFSALYSR